MQHTRASRTVAERHRATAVILPLRRIPHHVGLGGNGTAVERCTCDRYCGRRSCSDRRQERRYGANQAHTTHPHPSCLPHEWVARRRSQPTIARSTSQRRPCRRPRPGPRFIARETTRARAAPSRSRDPPAHALNEYYECSTVRVKTPSVHITQVPATAPRARDRACRTCRR